MVHFKTVTRVLAVLVVLVCLTRPASAGPDSQIEFTVTEGTWISLDIAPDGKTLVFELVGDVYSLSSEGGEAKPILTGRAFQSQPRCSSRV